MSLTLSALDLRSAAPIKRSLVAEFHKDPRGRLSLFSVTTITEETALDGHLYLARNIYDVDWSKEYSYIFHLSGGGGCGPIAVSGIYFIAGNVEIKEEPTRLVDGHDRPPWRGKKTRAIRKRNRTRRLRRLPKAFDVSPGQDLLDWLESNAIQEDAVWCSACSDHLPGDSLCEHCWWCNRTGWYSTPTDRCKCESLSLKCE